MESLYSREAVLYDVANLAYVVGDIREGDYSPHALHHTFDICAPGNIDRVNRVLDLAAGEATAVLERSGHVQERRRGLPRYVRDLLHEYLVATVLADWLSVSFPPPSASAGTSASKAALDNPAAVWKEKAAEALMRFRRVVAGGKNLVRRVPPI